MAVISRCNVAISVQPFSSCPDPPLQLLCLLFICPNVDGVFLAGLTVWTWSQLWMLFYIFYVTAFSVYMDMCLAALIGVYGAPHWIGYAADGFQRCGVVTSSLAVPLALICCLSLLCCVCQWTPFVFSVSAEWNPFAPPLGFFAFAKFFLQN